MIKIFIKLFLSFIMISNSFSMQNEITLVGESRYALGENESLEDARLICRNDALQNMGSNIMMLPPEAIKIRCFLDEMSDITLVQETLNQNLLYLKYEAKILTSALFGKCAVE